MSNKVKPVQYSRFGTVDVDFNCSTLPARAYLEVLLGEYTLHGKGKVSVQVDEVTNDVTLNPTRESTITGIEPCMPGSRVDGRLAVLTQQSVCLHLRGLKYLIRFKHKRD